MTRDEYAADLQRDSQYTSHDARLAYDHTFCGRYEALDPSNVVRMQRVAARAARAARVAAGVEEWP